MLLKSTIYYVTMFVVALCMCLSCSRSPTGIVEDSNNFNSPFPCWEQLWEFGNWEPLKLDSSGSIRTWDAINVGDGTYWSVCDKCDSARILDFSIKKEKIILSPRPTAKDCDHKWIAGAGRESSDLVEVGDILVVQQKYYFFIFIIQEATLNNWEVTYKVTKFNLKDRWPVKIDLSKVKWKEQKSHKSLPIVGRGIEFDYFPTRWTNNEPDWADNEVKLIVIWYDQYYGGSNGPEAVLGDDAAKIAIIHKNDIAKDSIIDLHRYRFKSWEDGMGNRCDGKSQNIPQIK